MDKFVERKSQAADSTKDLINIFQDQIVHSQFVSKYEKIIGLKHMGEADYDYQHLVTLQSLGLYCQERPFKEQFSLKLQRSTINCEIMIIDAAWGKITQSISVLNFNKNNSVNVQRQTYQKRGHFSFVYEAIIDKEVFVVKCTPFSLKDKKSSILMAIKECFFLKLASILEFGPKIQSNTGIDLIIYENCSQMFMEKCWTLKEYVSQQKKNLDYAPLRQSLYLMHRLNMFHFDIKTENIMYSPSLKKLIYIDFNLTQMKKAEFGFKILSRFRGTLNFCYEEMFHLYSVQQKSGYIDPFYNDAYSLNTSIDMMRKIYSKSCIQYLQQQQGYCPEFQMLELTKPKRMDSLMVGKLKMQLFLRQWKEAVRTIDDFCLINNPAFLQEIPQFLEQLDPIYKLKQFYHVHLSQSLRDDYRMPFLNKLLDYQNYFSIYQMRIKKQLKELYLDRIPDSSTRGSDFSKQECQKLLKENSTIELNWIVYSKIFLQFISYSHNVTEIDYEQRLKISEFCLKKIKQMEVFGSEYQEIIHQFQEDDYIRQSIAVISRLCCYKLKKNQSEYKRQLKAILDLCSHLIDHLLILDVGSLPFLMDTLENMFNFPIFTFREQFTIFLRVKQYRKWTEYRLTNKKGVQRFNVFREINFMLLRWFTSLKQNCPEEYYQWIKMIEDPSKIKRLAKKDHRGDSNISKQIQVFLRSEGIQSLIYSEQQNQLDNLVNQIYQQIQIDHRDEIYPILLVLTEYFLFHESNDKYINIMRKIIDNVRDIKLLEELIIYQDYQCHLQTQTRPVIHVHCKWKALKELSLQDWILHIKQVDSMLQEQQFFEKSIQYLDKRSKRQNHPEYQQMVNKLLNFAHYYLFQFTTGQIYPKEHQPVTFYHFSVCIKILTTLSPGEINEGTFSQLQEIRNKMSCRQCQLQLDRCLLTLKQAMILVNRATDQQDQYFMYQRLIEALDQNDLGMGCLDCHTLFRTKTCVFDRDLNLCKFCHLNPQLQDTYHGIVSYFMVLKEKDAFQQYFKAKGSTQKLISKTMITLFNTDTTLFFDFLLNLSLYMNNNSSQHILGICRRCINSWAETVPGGNCFLALFMVNYTLQQKCWPEFAIFLHFFIFPYCHLMPQSTYKNIQKFTCLNLQALSLLFRQEVELNLYKVYVFEERRTKAGGRARKIRFICRIIVKLNHRIGNVAFWGKKKRKQQRDDKKQMLLSKIKRIDYFERIFGQSLYFIANI